MYSLLLSVHIQTPEPNAAPLAHVQGKFGSAVAIVFGPHMQVSLIRLAPCGQLLIPEAHGNGALGKIAGLGAKPYGQLATQFVPS